MLLPQERYSEENLKFQRCRQHGSNLPVLLLHHTEKLLVRIRLTTKAILKPQKIYEYNCLTGGITLLLQEQISAIAANIPPVIPITVAMLEKV